MTKNELKKLLGSIVKSFAMLENYFLQKFKDCKGVDLSEKYDISAGYISDLKSGEKPFTEKVLIKLTRRELDL